MSAQSPVMSYIPVSEALANMIKKLDRDFRAELTPMRLNQFNGRLERGLELALKGAVQPVPTETEPRRCLVVSSDGSQVYHADPDRRFCECPDSLKGNHCKHRVAAYLYTKACALLAEQRQSPASETRADPGNNPSKPTPTPRKTNEQILSELGFRDGVSAQPADTGTVPTVQLGSLYRLFLHGEDLKGNAIQVTITNLTRETVTPHPSQPAIIKWCLWVSGLPDGQPGGILFGAQGEHELVSIFGRVGVESLKGKALVIYPQPVNVAGQPRIAIRFRSAT